MDINRLINRLNPRAPRAVIGNSGSWIEGWHAKPGAGGERPCPADRVLSSPAENRPLDFGLCEPVTEEDYLLDVDIAKNRRVEARPKWLLTIPHGRVLGPEGYIISPDNRIFSELTYSRAATGPLPVFRRRRFPRLRRLPGRYISLVYPDSGNYYHWLLESLPNLKAVESTIGELDGVFVPQLKPFHVDSLACFGIARDRLIELTGDSYFSCELLLAPTFSTAWALFSWVPGWLRAKMLEPGGRAAGRKLYVSRRDATWRRVLNEPDVVRLVESAGYETVELSSLRCPDQAQLFNSATAVISVHGAGLTNLAFCEPGTRVLEVFPRRWTSLCYLQLATLVGCKYKYMITSPLGQDPDSIAADKTHVPTGSGAQGSDMEIPIDKLDLYLRQQAT